MAKIRYFVQQSWLLIVSSFFFGLLIAVTNTAWSPKIKQNEKDKLNNLMRGLITSAQSFEIAIQQADIAGERGKFYKTDIYKALDNSGKIVGFAFIAAGAGFADEIKLVIAVDDSCRQLYGFKVLSSSETPGFGDKIKDASFSNQFKNIPIENFVLVKTAKAENESNKIVAISGATVTSTAVVKIFNGYLDRVKEHLQKNGLIDNGK